MSTAENHRHFRWKFGANLRKRLNGEALKEWWSDFDLKVWWSDLASPVLQHAFWFFVLVSWLPLLAGLENIVEQLNPTTWHVKGAGRDLATPKMLPYALITITILLAGLGSPGRRWVIAVLGFTPAFFATILAGISNVGEMSAEVGYFTTGYLASVLVTALIFVCYGRIRSLYMGLFLTLAAIEAATGLFESGPILIFGHLFRTYALSILDLFFFIILIAFARFIVRIIQDNIPVIKDAWGPALVIDALRAIWLWLPMLALFLGFNYFWNWLEASLDRTIASALVHELPNAPPDPTLEEAIKFATAHAASEAGKKSQDAVKATDAKAQATVADLINTSLPAIRNSFPPYLMKPSRCAWYDILCHVMNGIRAVVNSVYRKARDVALNEIERQARASQALMAKTGAEAVTEANKQIDAARKTTVDVTTKATKKIFETTRLIAFLLAIYSIIMLVKTYFVVIARVAYRDGERKEKRKDRPLVASLRTPWSAPVAGKSPIKVAGNEFVIRKTNPNFYVATAFEVRNAVPNFAVPYPLTGVIGRVLARRYALGFLKTKGLDDEATIVVNAPNNLVRWDLGEGDEVILQLRSLVAFSEKVRFATEINVSIPALIFGRFIFHKLVGPGTIVIRTDGAAVAGKDRDTDESRRPTALKAWDKVAGFRIQTNLNHKGLYFGSYNIRKQDKDDLIYDTAAQTTSTKTLGLASAIRIFLMPF